MGGGSFLCSGLLYFGPETFFDGLAESKNNEREPHEDPGVGAHPEEDEAGVVFVGAEVHKEQECSKAHEQCRSDTDTEKDVGNER